MLSDIKHGQNLSNRNNIWKKKPVLRELYKHYYKKIINYTVAGKTLEIGGGSGDLKNFCEETIVSDIQLTHGLDVVSDAQFLPFANSTFDNVILCDVLHHIESPPMFFDEAKRVLKSGGRIVLLEPVITPISHLVLGLTHPEPIYMKYDPFYKGPVNPKKNPFDANQAIPTLIFCRKKGLKRFSIENPDLNIISCKLLSLFAYPLSGGFREWNLIPKSFIKPLLRVESVLMPILGPIMAFRVLIIIEKN
ncbi:MAG: SAM-dependent methyltransferase [Alphaproteobacteria bacterium]|nr:SAM-dependent methyltransferase [Alphaproteobacteria bacterium]|tara:strand:- start:9332 stop:10078 length:747 start_codon:yes stop_codon:yes gene_type:complete